MRYFLISIFLCLFVCSCGKTPQDVNIPDREFPLSSKELLGRGYKKYQVESGKIEYFTGDFDSHKDLPFDMEMTSKIVVYFDRWGLRHKTIMEISTFASHGELATIPRTETHEYLVDGDLTFHIIDDLRQIKQSSDIELDPHIVLVHNEVEKIDGLVAKNFHGSWHKEKIFLGRECQILKSSLEELELEEWRWKSISLKFISGVFDMIAIDVDVESPLPEDIFVLPEDYTIQDRGKGEIK